MGGLLQMSGALHQNISYTPDEKKTKNLKIYIQSQSLLCKNLLKWEICMHSGTCKYFQQETVLKAVVD